MVSNTTTRSSRLSDTLTVVQAIIKQPVREAVHEALEEERRGKTKTTEVTTQESSGGSSKLRRLFGIATVVGLAWFVVRRRQRLSEAAPTIRGESSMEETDIETGTPETASNTGPEDETDFGTETPDEETSSTDFSVDE